MTGYTLALTLDRPYDEVVRQVKEALADQGFGVLTEIDVRATMKAKLGVDVSDQVILGACRPELAHRALEAAPSVAALLPCNVVVRTAGRETVVEVVDPAVMSLLEDGVEIGAVATEARSRLSSALHSLATTEETRHGDRTHRDARDRQSRQASPRPLGQGDRNDGRGCRL